MAEEMIDANTEFTAFVESCSDNTGERCVVPRSGASVWLPITSPGGTNAPLIGSTRSAAGSRSRGAPRVIFLDRHLASMRATLRR
jgi:hypothetical protein